MILLILASLHTLVDYSSIIPQLFQEKVFERLASQWLCRVDAQTETLNPQDKESIRLH